MIFSSQNSVVAFDFILGRDFIDTHHFVIIFEFRCKPANCFDSKQVLANDSTQDITGLVAYIAGTIESTDFPAIALHHLQNAE